MEEMKPHHGIDREEYLVAVRLCPTNPAFAAAFDDWNRATLKELERVLFARKVATKSIE